jgi:hypothetical protein
VVCGMSKTDRTGVVGVEPWNSEWAAERASEALHYLARNYPKCAASEALREHEEAAHEAAMRGGGGILGGPTLLPASGKRRGPAHTSGCGLMVGSIKIRHFSHPTPKKRKA